MRLLSRVQIEADHNYDQIMTWDNPYAKHIAARNGAEYSLFGYTSNVEMIQ